MSVSSSSSPMSPSSKMMMRSPTLLTATAGTEETNFETWTSDEIATYIQSKFPEEAGMEEYGNLFRRHKIDGAIIHRIQEHDLKEMGVTAVGDRHRILTALDILKEQKQQSNREQILWTGHEELYWSCWNKCCTTCGGMCKEDPEHYILRYNYLEIQRPDYNKCGALKCCFGHSYQIDTIDLSNVKDVNVDGIPPPCMDECCCGATTQEHVHILVANKKGIQPMLRLHKPIGQEVSRKLKNQVEIMQMMERS